MYAKWPALVEFCALRVLLALMPISRYLLQREADGGLWLGVSCGSSRYTAAEAECRHCDEYNQFIDLATLYSMLPPQPTWCQQLLLLLQVAAPVRAELLPRRWPAQFSRSNCCCWWRCRVIYSRNNV